MIPIKNPAFSNEMLPVEIVFHPSWWHKHCGISFDEDFFYHPLKRVESERRMEKELYERFGQYGLGSDRDKDLPQIGAVHNAAGYLLSEMLGCEIRFFADSAPQVIPAQKTDLSIDVDTAFACPAFKRLEKLMSELKSRFGYLKGDVNWGGILNLAMDLRGEEILMDLCLQPEEVKLYFKKIAELIERFFCFIQKETGSNSISVNRNVINIRPAVYLHSECSHTMISEEQYEEFLLSFDVEWSKKYRPYGVHYCGPDPHRHAAQMAKIPHLDFLDAGWGGDLACLRSYLPSTFINIRLDPVSINTMSCETLEGHIRRLVKDCANPWLTGICCINMDDKVTDDKIHTIFSTAAQLRREYRL